MARLLAVFLVQMNPPIGAVRPEILHLSFSAAPDAREGIIGRSISGEKGWRPDTRSNVPGTFDLGVV
jgi:hypothetical protein